MSEQKGILNYYLYMPGDAGQEQQTILIDLFLKINAASFEKINRDSGYQIMIIPIMVREATRIEKIDFENPFPRYAKKTHIDFVEEDRREALRNQERLDAKQKKEE